MLVLHTSDWHLGRTFHGASLLAEQRAAVERIVALAAERRVDLVVIAGDLFDRAIPPAEAVALWDDALAALHGTGAAVVAVAGNHDSATRVAVNDRLLERAGVTIRGRVGRLLDPVVLTPSDGGPPVAVYPIPYLEPSLAGPQLDALGGSAHDGDDRDGRDRNDSDGDGDGKDDDGVGEDGDGKDDDGVGEDGDGATPRRRRLSHHDVTAQAIDLVRGHAATIGPVRTVVVAHTFVTGGSTSESERDLTIGNIDLVDRAAFAGIDLVTLGHLHGPQAWDDGRIAYSGTPLPYSFSEEHHTKSVRLVELAPDGSCSVEVVQLGVGRPLRTLRGTLDELLDDPALADAVEARVRAELTDRELPLHAMARLQQRFPHAVALSHLPDGIQREAGGADVVRAVREAATPLELAERFWADQHGRPVDPAEREVLRLALASSGATGDEGAA